MTGDTTTDRAHGTVQTTGARASTGRTKKELAGRAGVSTKTLRRIETGESVSERTRSKVRAAIEADKNEASPIREAHLDALRDLRAIADVSGLEETLRAVSTLWLRFLAAPMAFLIFAMVERIVRSPEIAWEFPALACYLGIVLYVVATTFAFRFHRRRERSDKAKAAALAPAVLEGIRMGSIRYLQTREEEMIRGAVGARALGDAKRAAPRNVQVA